MKFYPILFLIGVCLLLTDPTSSAQTLAVGNCRPNQTSYATIAAAVVAAAPNSTVIVCPGVYPEQVTITQSLTLRGVTDETGAKAVITVPAGGLSPVSGEGAQLFIQGTGSIDFEPVDISNIIVDGTGSGFDCAAGILVGISYESADGTLDNVEVRNQDSGGCGFGIRLFGSPFVENTVKVTNSWIHDFDGTGLLASSDGATGFEVDLTANWVTSRSTTVQAGIDYELTDGLAVRNTIIVSGQVGLLLDNFFAGMTARENIIVGASVGIISGRDLPFSPTLIVYNNLMNNGIGISVAGSNAIVRSNAIAQSAIAAIDLDCSPGTLAKYNAIYNAPVGIANVTSGDTVARNIFSGVATTMSSCPL